MNVSDSKVSAVWMNLSLLFSLVSWCPVSVALASSPRAVWLASLSLGLSRALQSSRDSIPALHSLRLWLPQPAYSEAANYARQCVCVSLAWTQPSVLASCAGPSVSPPASRTLQMKPWERSERGWMVFSLTSAAWCFKLAPDSQQVSSTLWSACFFVDVMHWFVLQNNFYILFFWLPVWLQKWKSSKCFWGDNA